MKLFSAEVLAGAYKGKQISNRNLLIHIIQVDDNGNWLRVLCNSVNLDNLTTDTGDVGREPTCTRCIRKRIKIFKSE